MPPPPPPYSSGRLTPMNPALPASAHSASVRPPDAGLLQEVGLPVAGAEVGHRRPQRPQLVALVEVQASRVPSGSITASTAPASTCAPTTTSRERTTPAVGGHNGVLHLHRLEHQQRLPGAHLVARRPRARRSPCRASARPASPPRRGPRVREAGQRRQRHRPAVARRRPPCRRPAPPPRRCSTPATSRTTSSGVADTQDDVVAALDQQRRCRACR